MDLNYFIKIQNSHGLNNRREKQLAQINREMERNFDDTWATDDVLINDKPFQLMILKDTEGNPFKKKIKSPHDCIFNLGDYIVWNNQVWLVTSIDPDCRTWNRGYMSLCCVLLRWQNHEGKIIERYGYSEDFTKYSAGITGNSTVTIGDNQYGITVPVDNETKILKRGIRFPIDFEDIEPPDIYELTNRKIQLSDAQKFNRGGILQWTLSYSEFNYDTDKKITLSNGNEIWICNYNDNSQLKPDINIEQLSFQIAYKGTPSIIAGGNYKKFTIIDKKGNSIPESIEWHIEVLPEHQDYILYEINDDNSIRIKALYNPLIVGASILLKATLLGQEESLTITIGGGI